MTAQQMLEFASAFLGMAGSFLVARRSRWAGWAFVLWLASNAGWIAFGAVHGHWGLVAQHIGFGVTSVIGIWTWLVAPWWGARALAKQDRAARAAFAPTAPRGTAMAKRLLVRALLLLALPLFVWSDADLKRWAGWFRLGGF